jgi:hypothetical protein
MGNQGFNWNGVVDERCFEDICPTYDEQVHGIDTELFNKSKCFVEVTFSQNYEDESIRLILDHDVADRLSLDGWEQQKALDEIIIKAINEEGYYPIRIEDLRCVEISNDIDKYDGSFQQPMRGSSSYQSGYYRSQRKGVEA